MSDTYESQNETATVSYDSTNEIDSGRSFYFTQLTKTERKFLNYVKTCRLSLVQNLIETNDFNLNCENHEGMTALNLAIESNCEEMVNLLLAQSRIKIGDSLMHAIRINNYSIVVKLLESLEAENQDNPKIVQQGYEDSREFPQYLTPLMLAAQCGHYRVVHLLLKRGHIMSIPHKPQCLCKEECKSPTQLKNGLGKAELKLAMFRALANPAYISLTSEDPILAAFQLSKMLREHGTVDRIFKSDYELLDLQTRMFAVHLISLCRTKDEMELILTRQEGCNFFGSFPYHRLVMAMDLKQKEFVAHAYVQQKLEVEWTGDYFHQWRRYGSARKSIIALQRILLLPWVVLLSFFLPYSKLGKHYSLPVNRMLNFVASYTVFLAVLTYENNADKCRPTDGLQYYAFKVVVVAYAFAFAVRTGKLILMLGPRRYFGTLWNVYDCVNLTIFGAIFACWALSYYKPMTVERKYWPASDPTLVAEALLAVATVMSYLRLLFLCQLSYVLGPMQVSLGKMTTDFARFAIQFGIIIMAFTAGLCRFYQYYDGMSSIDPVNGYEWTQEESFISVYSTMKTLFWGIFCMTSPSAGSVVIETTADDDDSIERQFPYFTQAVGTFLYSVFETLSVIVMLNMLIATMTNTFQRITGNSYIEWVFGRTQVFLSFSVYTDLPPPFNPIPTIPCLIDSCGFFGNCCKAGAISVANMISSKKYNMKAFSNDEFKNLMARLVRRYFRDKLVVSRKCNPFCG